MDDLSAVRPGYYRTPVNACRWSWARTELDARESEGGRGRVSQGRGSEWEGGKVKAGSGDGSN